MDIENLTINKIHQGLASKEFSALELAQAHLARIEKNDKGIFSFLTLAKEQALWQAKAVDKLLAQGSQVSLLAGVPCAVKDNMMVENVKCTAGSRMLENYVAPYDATTVKELKDAGAVILGKTNLDEFAMGSSTENSAFGPTKNPHDLKRVAGGSSGGSAAAVAANMAVFSLGSDTGGSIRLPSSFCGVVGLKPTYGAVSRYGLIAFASSFDQIGPLAKTVEDCQIVFDAIKGRDEKDSTSVNPKSQIPNPKFEIRNLKIGVPKEYFVEGTDPGVEKVIKAAIKKYEDMGTEIIQVSLPHTEYALACYYIIVPSEASANLARYDGVKYGHSEAKDAKRKEKNLLDVYLQSREKGFGAEVKRRIMLGTYALSAGYYDAYYLRAQKVRQLIKQDFDNAFGKVDVIFTPTSPTTAFRLGEKTDDPLTMYLADIFTVSVNLAGLPALSLPVGKAGNLPVGLQIIGRPFEEHKILEVGKKYHVA
ncbi:MAG: glutamyl-tRNA(Gln) and/or aspartyl-tRNA(Asn) amidotransferase subunit A [Parcubacteria group bacterium Gr01-1014_30]|nr:MAG: glutamyl-tRNA(Gln) and/or aspartyl-tRNA(Asn) amidotransferase subunit A [Parcubacteria group bacterium Gr01-1014_30]